MPDDLLLAAAMLMAAATLQGFLGFGFGIAAMSALTLSHDLVHASGVVNLTGGVMTAAFLFHLRAKVLWPTVARIVPALLLGVLVGVGALGSLDRGLMVRVLGATIVGISLWNLAAPRLREHGSLAADAVAGFLGGMLGGAFNTGGPPLIAHLYRRAEGPAALKGTIQAIFLSISLARAPLAAASGLLGGEVVREATLLLPAVLLGLWAGDRASHRVSPDRFRRLAWIALGLLGVVLLVRSPG